MKLLIFGGRYVTILALSLCGMGLLLSPPKVAAQTEPTFAIKPVAEKKLKQLPAGPLYWQGSRTSPRSRTGAGRRGSNVTGC
jgi:hypothetical protein